jgi:hypothetical protein
LPYDQKKMLNLPWRRRWLAGEHQAAAEWGGMHTGAAAGIPIPARGGDFPVVKDTTRKPDVTAPGGAGKILLVEVKTYGTYVTVNGKPEKVSVSLDERIKAEIHADVAAREDNPNIDIRWVFYGAPPTAELSAYLAKAGIVVIIHQGPEGPAKTKKKR